MNAKAIAAIVGHNDVSITMNRYTTLSRDFLQESMNMLGTNKKVL